MQGKSNWYGKEVEGRLHGLLTKFIRYEVGSLDIPDLQHLYFTKEFIDTVDNAAKQIEDLSINTKYMISVECNSANYHKITPNMKVRCHLIYRIEDDMPFDLKETDSIFIDKKEMYNVLCFTKHQAYKVTPIDYSNDVL